MSEQKLYFIELRSDQNDRGPAWIGRVTFSRSGRTAYFNGRALARGRGVAGNHYCVETGDEYWVSGVKKDGSDRHWAGGGPVMIDARVVEEYCALRGLVELDPTQYVVVDDIEDTDVSKFHDLENEPLADLD